MLWTDLRELKPLLDIDPDNGTEDKKLGFMIRQASAWMEEVLDRPGFSYKERTEFYNGTGTSKLLLRSRPVRPATGISVWVDQTGFWGASSGSFNAQTQLTFGTDFSLWIDREDGSSRNGILIRNHAYWPKPMIREAGYLSPFRGEGLGCIKVQYSGGYLVDDMPAQLRLAATLLVAKLRAVLPYGSEMNSESYEERSISVALSEKNKLLGLIEPMIGPYRNRYW